MFGIVGTDLWSEEATLYLLGTVVEKYKLVTNEHKKIFVESV